AEKRPMESGPAYPVPAVFTPSPLPDATLTAQDVLTLVTSGSDAQIVDVRPAARFEGTHPEPRPGLRSGHIPGSYNVPFGDLVTHGTLVSDADLRSAITR